MRCSLLKNSETPSVLSTEAVIKQMKEDKIRFIRLENTDIHGIARGKTVPIRHFSQFASKGINCCYVPMTPQADIVPIDKFLQSGCIDSKVMPDLSTYVKLPFVEKTARFIGDIVEGPMKEIDCRGVLKNQLKRLEQKGLSIYSGFEMEFMILDESNKPVYPGINYMNTLRNNFDNQFLNKMLDSLEGIGIDYLAAHAEYGPGQYEINLAPKHGLEMADAAFSFKTTLKEIAKMDGKTITFMAKPFADYSGNGMHHSHSLWNLANPSKNLFYDSENDNISKLAKSWIAGLLKHSSALSALCAPTINCYKRLKENTFAPTLACWSFGNRTASFRLKCLDERDTYIENRIVSGSANPYLLMAGTIAAGLDGIENNLELCEESKGWIYGEDKVNDWRPELPRQLDQALEALENDKMYEEAFGNEFISVFLACKRFEISMAKESDGETILTREPTEWERNMYLEFL